MRKLLTILALIIVLIFFTGCMQNVNRQSGDDIDFYQNSANTYYAEFESFAINKNDPDIQMEIKLKKFLDFSKEIFPIIDNNIKETAPILEKFNSNNDPDEKILLTGILYNKYIEFKKDINKIVPPPEAYKAYQYLLDSISGRILLFKKYEEGEFTDSLIMIKNESYLYENLFWDEMNRIYDQYLEEIDQKNVINV
jgi:hypothetical protein